MITPRSKTTVLAAFALSIAACGGDAERAGEDVEDIAEQAAAETGEAIADAEDTAAAAIEEAEAAARAAIEEAVAGEHRSEENRARDRYRHPVETLTFFGLEPDMTVVEVWPGRGWYTEILAPALADEGKLYLAHLDPESDEERYAEVAAEFREWVEAHRDAFGDAEVTVLQPPKTEIAPPGSADMVLTFRNLHGWMGRGYAQEVFDAMYTALKPGGILGIVQHRADPGTEQDPEAKTGYVTEEAAIEMAEDAGFVLVDSSEVNANPNDTKDYEEGVWALPPTLRGGDEDRERYEAIGESDRFTLKFMKPVQSSAAAASGD